MRRNKYNAKRISGFDSQLEYSVYQWLKLLEDTGQATDIKKQEKVSLTKAQVQCRIDFSYIDTESNEKIYVEAKGVETPRWRLIKKLWKHYGPGDLQVIKGTARKLDFAETIKVDKNI